MTIPLFSFLGPKELSVVQEHFVETTHQKGDIICRAGDEGDKFFLIRNGELEVWAGEGEQRLTGTLKRGDYFGEMALLQGGKRSATVIVKRRARLLSLDKASFDKLFLKDPKTLEYFTRVLCKRLASVSKGAAVHGTTTTIGVLGRPGLKGKSIVAAGLAGILHDLTGADVLLVRAWPGKGAPQGAVEQLLSDDLDIGTDKVSPGIQTGTSGVSTLDVPVRIDKTAQFYADRSSNLIARVSDHFRFIVYDLGSEPKALMDSAKEFADVIIELVERPEETIPATNGAPTTKRLQVINLFNPGSPPIPINHCEPFVIPRDFALSTGDCSEYIRTSRRGPAAVPIHRLARKLLGASVGLALGGGAAFGVSHLGVLKVLEQNNIPIDLIAGCSQGSIIGVGYAAGIPVDDMIAMARKLGQKRNFLAPMDLTISKPGILAGNKFINLFEPLLEGKVSFEDLLIPCNTVATDIENGERVAIGTGKLSDAFRASASVPMVFAPWRMGDRVLVDGGVSDPVPAEVVNNMGADLCIAVNVVPPLKKGLENEVSKAYRIMNKFNPLSYLGDSRSLPNMFDIIMNSMQTLQYELGNFKAISADVLINPELADFTWIEYYRSEELIQRGIEAAERAIPAIQSAYAQKLSPFKKQVEEKES